MVQAVGVRLQFGGRVLFDDVNIKFSAGHCYGIIGANGAGKSTFLKLLSGEIEPNKGEISIEKGRRMSVLSQNQNAYNNKTVMQTVILGHERLAQIMEEKDAIYSKTEFTDEDGVRAGELEGEFAELNGWEAESEAEKLLLLLGVPKDKHETLMGNLDAKFKVKVLLAKALFFEPDILVLDEPTNNLDSKTTRWLENYLMDLEQTCIIIVSHNRHFLNRVCTNICDVDYSKISSFVGNYDFWYESSQLLLRQAKEQNKKAEARAAELKDFIARFSANASKSKQATSRKKELEKLEFADIKISSRKYPYIDFRPERDLGNEVLFVENLTKKGFFENVNFTITREEKVAFLSTQSQRLTMLFKVLMGEEKADSGSFRWGATVKISYLPENNDKFFNGVHLNLIEWLRQYSKDKDITFIRGWLGRMLFSGEESLKEAHVLSGGEKVRCMLAKAMLDSGNILLLDEPINHLDLESITALNKGMINFKGPILFTTHDEEILATVANRIIEIDEIGKKVYDKMIDYETYMENK